MPLMQITRWAGSAQDMDCSSVEQGRWHFVEAETDNATCCGEDLPLQRTARHYAEVDTDQLVNISGFCFNCFHMICQIEQAAHLWEIFERVQRIRDGLDDLEQLINAAKSSSDERNEALQLLASLRRHSIVDTLTGGDGT